MPNARHALTDRLIFVLLLAVGIALYAPIFAIRPLRGDNLYVLAWVHSAPFSSLLRVDPAIYPEWRPLAYLTIWIEHHLLGIGAVPVHFFVNLLIWTTAAWLIYRIVDEVAASKPAAILAALVPFFDPRATEALTWIVERQTLIACACGLLAILFLARARDRDLTRREAVMVAVALMASALGKEYGLAFAAAIVVFALWHARRVTAIAAVAAMCGYLLLRVVVAGGAVGEYCEDMGYFTTASTYCHETSASGLAQVAYNAAASTVGTILPGLFGDLGEIGIQPRRTVRGLIWLGIAAVGWISSGPMLRMVALVPLFNGLLNFMLYRERNHLVGLCAFAILIGVGLARWRPELRLVPVARTLRVAVIAALALMLSWKAYVTSGHVAGVAAHFNGEEPCESSVRERRFGPRFVTLLKTQYGMSNPQCIDEDEGA